MTDQPTLISNVATLSALVRELSALVAQLNQQAVALKEERAALVARVEALEASQLPAAAAEDARVLCLGREHCAEERLAFEALRKLYVTPWRLFSAAQTFRERRHETKKQPEGEDRRLFELLGEWKDACWRGERTWKDLRAAVPSYDGYLLLYELSRWSAQAEEAAYVAWLTREFEGSPSMLAGEVEGLAAASPAVDKEVASTLRQTVSFWASACESGTSRWAELAQRVNLSLLQQLLPMRGAG